MQTSGNKVLLTGASSGIGLALTEKFLNNGNQVIALGRNIQALTQMAVNNPALFPFACDLTRQEEIDRLLVFIEQTHKDLNIVVNNAGIQYNYDFLNSAADVVYKIEQEVAINVTAPLKLCALLLPLLQMQPQAAIINVSSGLAIAPKKSAPVYCATKAGIHSFSQALRYQLANGPVKVFEIIPPLVNTPMTQGRGRNKLSPEQLTDEFWKYFSQGTYEMYIGKARLLKLINRLSPRLARRIMQNS